MRPFTVRAVQKKEVDILLFFINKLAEYENLQDKVKATTNRLEKYGFSSQPYFNALFCIDEKKVIVGFALYFFTFSTFLAKPSLFLEDLFVLPQHRLNGAGKELFKKLVSIAKEKGCGRIEWCVLDWNESAIRFYHSLGAKPVNGWTVYRLDENGINNFAL